MEKSIIFPCPDIWPRGTVYLQHDVETLLLGCFGDFLTRGGVSARSIGGTERWNMNEFTEMRRLADVTLHVAAAKISVSTTKLWHFENGRSELTPDQISILRRHYARLIQKRFDRIRAFLVTEI